LLPLRFFLPRLSACPAKIAKRRRVSNSLITPCAKPYAFYSLIPHSTIRNRIIPQSAIESLPIPLFATHGIRYPEPGIIF